MKHRRKLRIHHLSMCSRYDLETLPVDLSRKIFLHVLIEIALIPMMTLAALCLENNIHLLLLKEAKSFNSSTLSSWTHQTSLLKEIRILILIVIEPTLIQFRI